VLNDDDDVGSVKHVLHPADTLRADISQPNSTD
jgi:hypothetical protein